MGTLYEIDGATGQARLTIQQGTVTPGSGTQGELFYRTDTKQLLAHDGSDFKALAGGSLKVYGETVNETPNGSITVFTVDFSYVVGTTELYVNGVKQKLGTDYTESDAANGEITFTTAPLTGATVEMSYSRVEGTALPIMFKFDVVVGTPKETYSGSTTVFDLPFSYSTGSGSLLVYSGGVLMLAGATDDYQETDGNTVTFNSARTTGEKIQFIKLGVSNSELLFSGWQDNGSSVSLITNTDQVQIGDGSVGTPALSFESDTDTGLYYISTNSFGLSAGGSLKFSIDSNGSNFSGALGLNSTTISSSTTLSTELVVLASNTITLTLPVASGATGRTYFIKNTDTGTVTIDGNGSETIDGSLTYVLNTQYESVTVTCDGSNWFII